MKKVILGLSIISILIFGSCARNTITSPNEKSNALGKLTLQIDKTNAPENVVTVTAYLTRPDYDTLSASMNLLTDSSADLFLQDIHAGQWHLTVNALNSSNEVVYTGETDVTISDGITTQVSLTLIPTGEGTGSIYIKVNWGSAQPLFVDNPTNPVFTIYQNPSNPRQVSEGKVIYDNGIFKMWYLCGYGDKGNIWYAESPDGINWTNKSDGPVLDVDTASAWDNFTVGGGSVIKDGDLYRMYFNGVNSPYGKSSVGYAYSSDGIHWQRYSQPVLRSDSSMQYHIGNESVIKINDTYYMYYVSSPIWNYDQWVINVATSTDGVTWTKYAGNPVLTATYSWEGIGVTYPTVINDGDHYLMIYISTDRKNYGAATSTDGIHWTKKYSQPIFSANSSHPVTDYPNLIKYNNQYWIYYTGMGSDGKLNISLVKAFNL